MKIRKNEDLLGLASIRVIASSGEMLGVMTPAEALRVAREQGLDLVEVNPRAQPPVCKMLDFARFPYEEVKKAALQRRAKTVVFLVRSKVVLQGRPGAFLVGDVVTGDAVHVGMVARIPDAHDGVHAVAIRSVEIVDHRAEKATELALHVVGDTPEQVAAIEALEGAHLIDIVGGTG